MTTRILVNTVPVGRYLRKSGSPYDSVSDAAEIADIEAAGGSLVDAGTPAIDAAALAANKLHLGGQSDLAEGVMAAAVTAHASTAAAALAGGALLRSGTGAPSNGLGADGDFYLDSAASDLYGPKTAGAWGGATSLIGPQGVDGNPFTTPCVCTYLDPTTADQWFPGDKLDAQVTLAANSLKLTFGKTIAADVANYYSVVIGYFAGNTFVPLPSGASFATNATSYLEANEYTLTHAGAVIPAGSWLAIRVIVTGTPTRSSIGVAYPPS